MTHTRRAQNIAAIPLLSFLSSFGAGCIVHGGGTAPAVGGGTAAPAEVAPLREAADAAHRRVGTALMSARLDDQRARTLVAANFDSLTPENEMKWETIE